MCILLTAWHHHPDYDLIVAANRDEFHARPAAPAAAWADHPHVLAGRDLEAGGTWLGVTTDGRFAAVTNVRRPGQPAGQRSRGMLAAEFLAQGSPADRYGEHLLANAERYAGVNLIFADLARLYAWSNRDNLLRALEPGVYGISNAALDDEWPKVSRLKEAYARHRKLSGEALTSALLRALRDDERAADDALPDTGAGLAAERMLSPIFISGGGYGTRCSSVVLRARDGHLNFVERRYDAHGNISGESRLELETR